MGSGSPESRVTASVRTSSLGVLGTQPCASSSQWACTYTQHRASGHTGRAKTDTLGAENIACILTQDSSVGAQNIEYFIHERVQVQGCGSQELDYVRPCVARHRHPADRVAEGCAARRPPHSQGPHRDDRSAKATSSSRVSSRSAHTGELSPDRMLVLVSMSKRARAHPKLRKLKGRYHADGGLL